VRTAVSAGRLRASGRRDAFLPPRRYRFGDMTPSGSCAPAATATSPPP